MISNKRKVWVSRRAQHFKLRARALHALRIFWGTADVGRMARSVGLAMFFLCILFSCLGRSSSATGGAAAGLRSPQAQLGGLGTGGWLCSSTSSEPSAYCGASASLVQQVLPLAAASACLPAPGVGSLVLLGDSVSRHALFDWLAEDAAGCGAAELSGAAEEACAALHAAGLRRGSYAVDAASGSAGLPRVRALAEDDGGAAIAAAIRGGAAFTFLSSTFFRNVTAAPWLAPALQAVAASGSPLVLSGGLWNLKYDAQPLATLQGEAQGLLDALRQAGVPMQAVLWRGLSATDARPTLPAQYTPAAVAEARAWLAGLWASAGARTLDIAPITSCAMAEDGSCSSSASPASGLTTDGTHMPLSVSVGVMRATLRYLCSAGVAEQQHSRRRALAAEEAVKQAPAAAAAAAAPAPPPAPLGGLMYATAVLTMFALMAAVSQYQAHRPALDSLLKTPIGAGAAYGLVLMAVFLCDVHKAFPIVGKDKAVGFDAMLVYFCLILAVALRTAAPVATAPPGQRPGGSAGKVATPERAASPSALGAGGGAAGAALGGGASAAAAGDGTASVPSLSTLEQGSLLTLTTAGSSAAAAAAASPTASASGAVAAAAAAAAAAPSHAAAGAADNGGFFPLPQSLEWKGWMMAFFLLYHYWDVKPAYNPIRVAVGAYLFLTGYGNFMSLAKKGPSLQKLAMSVLRINLFTASVMLVTGRGWVLYYIAPLHTFWTCVVYGYYWVPASIPPLQRLGGILAAIVVVYEVPLLANYLYAPAFPLLAYCGELKEWVFRSRLDAYAPWCGMMFAHMVPSIVEWLDRDKEDEGGEGVGAGAAAAAAAAADGSSSSSALAPSLGGAAGGAAAAPIPAAEQAQRAVALYPALPHSVATWAAALGLLRPSGALRVRLLGAAGVLLTVHLVHAQLYAMVRFDYNAVNRFTEWIPIATFLILRNLTPALRATHLRLFAWLGEMSLELYILQFHVWMAEDAKKLVVLLPAFRGVSFMVATAAFVLFAWASSAATGLAMKHIEAQGRSAVLGAAGALLVVMCGINMLGPRSCAVGGAGGR